VNVLDIYFQIRDFVFVMVFYCARNNSSLRGVFGLVLQQLFHNSKGSSLSVIEWGRNLVL